jgi:phospholipid/cholesterol/gamma-HCH transport system substrate-binding protein
MRREIKIAIFAIITMGLAIWGFKFLTGFNILAKKTILYATYEKVDGLRISTPVMIHGLQVGLVANIRQDPQILDKIEVEMNLDKALKIPKSTVAEIVSANLMGNMAINLNFTESCSGDNCIKSGDHVKGVTKGMLGSFATPEEVRVYVDELNKGLQNVLDSLSAKLSQSAEIQGSVKDVRAILANLRVTTERLNGIMDKSGGAITNTMKNLETITGSLRESNQQIKNILANAEAVSSDLKNANIAQVSSEAKLTMQKLQSTLATSDKAIANLDALLKGLKDGDGAVGLLLNDKEFANSLQVTVKNMDLLLQDLRLHPERYRRILSKKKMPYEKPDADPGHH